uniref:Uncharacterized protein n=1 Tax=viral metagenome TaxID=1070528 RepID=A0A2V0RBV2_9ZZZZ
MANSFAGLIIINKSPSDNCLFGDGIAVLVTLGDVNGVSTARGQLYKYDAQWEPKTDDLTGTFVLSTADAIAFQPYFDFQEQSAQGTAAPAAALITKVEAFNSAYRNSTEYSAPYLEGIYNNG